MKKSELRQIIREEIQLITEAVEDNVSSDHDYGVFFVGGSIGETKTGVIAMFGRDRGSLRSTHPDATEAKTRASKLRKLLSPGERQYYGSSYKVKKLTPKEKEQIKKEYGK